MTANVNVTVTIIPDRVGTRLPTADHAHLKFERDSSSSPTINVDPDGTIDLKNLEKDDMSLTFTLKSPIKWGEKSYAVSFEPARNERSKGRENFVLKALEQGEDCSSSKSKTSWSLANREFDNFAIGSWKPTLSVDFRNRKVNGKAVDYCYGMTIFVYDEGTNPVTSMTFDPQIKNTGGNGKMFTIGGIDVMYLLPLPLVLVGALFIGRRIRRRFS